MQEALQEAFRFTPLVLQLQCIAIGLAIRSMPYLSLSIRWGGDQKRKWAWASGMVLCRAELNRGGHGDGMVRLIAVVNTRLSGALITLRQIDPELTLAMDGCSSPGMLESYSHHLRLTTLSWRP